MKFEIAEIAITDITRNYRDRKSVVEKWKCRRDKYNELVKIVKIS